MTMMMMMMMMMMVMMLFQDADDADLFVVPDPEDRPDVHNVSILCYIISPHGVAVMSHKNAQTRVKGELLV